MDKKIVDLSDKLIVVTGASNGIGESTAILLSELGAKVVLIARNKEKLQTVSNNMTGEGHSYYEFDLRQISDIEKLCEKIINDNGKIDGLVHCAGIGIVRPLNITKYEVIHDTLLVHFYSFVELVRIFSKSRYFNPNCSIVAMSSTESVKGEKAKVAYSSAKAAIDSAVRVMAAELTSKNIRVNSIRASFIETDMYYGLIAQTGNENVNKIISEQPLGLGQTIDIANAIAFLLSDASRFITGTHLAVDGGVLAK